MKTIVGGRPCPRGMGILPMLGRTCMSDGSRRKPERNDAGLRPVLSQSQRAGF